jgi:hypothetical protein
MLLAKTTNITGLNDIAAADVAALLPTNFSALVIDLAGIVAVNVKQVNDFDIQGAGTAGNPWGPAV